MVLEVGSLKQQNNQILNPYNTPFETEEIKKEILETFGLLVLVRQLSNSIIAIQGLLVTLIIVK